MNCVLLETSRLVGGEARSYIFLNPVRLITASDPGDVTSLFPELERCLDDGYYVAGYLRYECGYAFERITHEGPPHTSHPLAWFGVYRDPIIFNHLSDSHDQRLRSTPCKRNESRFAIERCSFRISESDYARKIGVVKDYIAAGDTYQVNLTDKYRFDFSGSPLAFYRTLRDKQPVGYGAFINAGGTHILSLSPELFFKLSRGRIVTRPMKGTAPRGKTLSEDDAMQEWLRNDVKNRSENLMIVDLLRSDVGRISKVGSVEVRKMFDVEKYETLFQMTSTVEGMLRPGLSLIDIFRSLFPSGSVTGAPKIRTMEIIHELEQDPRGVYTGAIGFVAPHREAVFSVAIRTIVINGSKGEMGVGGGIVFDSDPTHEYEECVLKARFLTEPRVDFKLIESILWDGEYKLLEYHLDRLRASATYFDFRLNEEDVRRALESCKRRLTAQQTVKVRLLIGCGGAVSLEILPITNQFTGNKVILSDTRTSSNDKFLYHKTTLRKLYDDEFAAASRSGFTEVLYRNERDEITEGAISNVFIERNGRRYTPPQNCGLLAGVFRRRLLETDSRASERILFMEDLRTADAVYVCNAVRGLQRVSLES